MTYDRKFAGGGGPVTPAQLPSSVVFGSQLGLAIGRGGCSVPIGDFINTIGNLQSNGTETSGTYRFFVPLADPLAQVVLPVFNNLVNFAPVGDVGCPNPITISAAVETSDGTVVPFTFNGQHSITISTSAHLAIPDAPLAFGSQVTDSLSGLKGVIMRAYVSVAAARVDTAGTTSGQPTVTDASILAADQGRRVTGTGIPSNTFVGTVTPGTSFLLSSSPTSQVNVNATVTNAAASLTIASYWPVNIGTGSNTNTRNGGAGSNGADLTTELSAGGAMAGQQNANCYGPALVLGRPLATKKPIVASLTDSIFNGTTDSYVGPMSRACAALGLPHVKVGKFAESAQSVATPAGRRYTANMLAGVTHVVIELGTNDGVNTVPKATSLQGYLTTLLTFFGGLGIKVYLTTVPPKGNSSTDGYATLAGQTPYNIAAALSQVNSWIRSGPANLSGYIELGDPVSSARDSSFWLPAANGRQVTDAVTTASSNVVTSATANFTSADIGSGIYVAGGLTSSDAVISATGLTSTSVNVVQRTNTGNARNATATVSGAVAGIGAWYSTADGTHPQITFMQGAILTAVQNLLGTFTV